MPSDDEASVGKRIADIAVELGQGARGAYDRVTSGREAPGLYAAADRRAGDAADRAVELGGLALRAAVVIGEELLDVARQVESRLDERAARTSAPADAAFSPAATETAAALDLPTVSPGGNAAARFTVRNASLSTIDVLPLRCDGLFDTDGARIPGRSISFHPPVATIAPQGTATVECVVQVPATAKRGGYTGLIEAPSIEGARLLVTLEVI